MEYKPAPTVTPRGTDPRPQRPKDLACPFCGLSANQRPHPGKLGTGTCQAECASSATNQSRQALSGHSPKARNDMSVRSGGWQTRFGNYRLVRSVMCFAIVDETIHLQHRYSSGSHPRGWSATIPSLPQIRKADFNLVASDHEVFYVAKDSVSLSGRIGGLSDA